VIKLPFLVGRIVFRQPFEGIPKHVVATALLIDRKVRLEETAIDPELLERVIVIAPGRFA